jgi:histidine ammonia-lyase
VPFEPRLNEVRGHPGQQRVARRLYRLLEGSAISASHLQCERVQDPYSLRCQPQVMGPCQELMDEALAILLREANGVSDNPLVFPADGAILSGGNFHGESVAFAADRIALALAEIGSLSERRTALLIDPGLSQLPAFLSPDPGLNSGFMLAQVCAAALASENQHLAHAVATDSRVTSAGQEDHVSMSTYAARRLLQMTDNAARIIAIELLAAAQGIELRRPLQSSRPLETAHRTIRTFSGFVQEDRPLGSEIDRLGRFLLEDGRGLAAAPGGPNL